VLVTNLLSFTILGHFDNEIDAACTYDVVAKKYPGEFAMLDLPAK